MRTSAIQIPVEYRKTLKGVILRFRDFFNLTVSFNDYKA